MVDKGEILMKSLMKRGTVKDVIAPWAETIVMVATVVFQNDSLLYKDSDRADYTQIRSLQSMIITIFEHGAFKSQMSIDRTLCTKVIQLMPAFSSVVASKSSSK